MSIWIGIILSCCCLVGGLYIRQLKLKQEAELEKLEAIFDQVIFSSFDPNEVKYEEGQLAKVIFKAQRIAEIAEDRKQTVELEHQRIQELIADISHQMRTPLSSIMMYTELMQMTGLSEHEAKEFLARIEVSSERLMWLASEFIVMTRFETETIDLQPELLDINQTLQQAIAENREAANQKGITIQLVFQEVNPLMHDSKWTAEAFSNVIENAVKYANPKTEISITVKRLLSYTRIDICNSGIGILPDEMRLIFQKYYRGENAGDMSGAGIGLHLTKLILERQGGYILAKETSEETVFSLFLLN
ncbi:sensor histidine kinase [Enterococcus sp. LJL51]|uniref:sensor histidine kinase n=1 Tax=Enterococcus sp. LJL51 TaxID=3416656 RepID=UPI003CF06DAB